MNSRRLLAQIVVCCLAFESASLALAQEPKPQVTTLRQAAGQKLLVGTAMNAPELDNAKLTSLIAAQFHCVTLGNEMKPDALQHVRGKFTFERADRIVAFARSHDMQVIGHTLLWHEQTPKWLFEDANGRPLPRDVALANLRTHIQTVVRHFAGKVKGWDVVNEAVNDAPDSDLRNTPARRAIGDDYVLKAFQFAHEADPDVELYYNDYNIEFDYKRDRALRIIRQIKAAGLRIDGVGIQGHWMLDASDLPALIEQGIRAYADEGLKVMITEMDVDPLPRKRAGSADLSATEQEGLDPYKAGFPDDAQQKLADRYRALFEVFLRYPNVTRVTLWGTDDGHSWLNHYPVRGRTNHPMLWDRQLQPKPAFRAVLEALQIPPDRGIAPTSQPR